MRQFKVAVFIGRFQIFHNGHVEVVRRALTQADNVIIVVGSADEPRSYYNPFTFKERLQMINDSLGHNERVRVVPVSDFTYNEDEWLQNVQKAVNSCTEAADSDIALIGHSKDNTSYYLNMFPQWKSINVPSFADGLSATTIRNEYFKNNDSLLMDIPIGSLNFLNAFRVSDAWWHMHYEFEFIERYGRPWGKGPFVTVDACVVQSGHILMIRRGGRPGQGLLALPGGFINRDETLKSAMLRELREETEIDVPPGVLQGATIATEAFDAPRRDPRARIITHTFLVNLPKNAKLPKVRGADDAAEAMWIQLNDLKGTECFGDHWHIIQRMRGYIPKDPR